LRDVGYEIGPFIALVDAESFDFSWQERSKLILNHIVGADVVAISRSDLTKLEQVEAIRETLEDHVENNRVLSLSTVLGRGIKEVMDRILVR
jgi:G3E family GTPase